MALKLYCRALYFFVDPTRRTHQINSTSVVFYGEIRTPGRPWPVSQREEVKNFGSIRLALTHSWEESRNLNVSAGWPCPLMGKSELNCSAGWLLSLH